ncbi:MAG TPA: 2,3,4,5-tetrahydropyridine-2,6-dicarboxylate N-succinyltransferase [Phenylobacterium sp.]|jgi:2,3,4,5-tetrahydropyridine-2-carboxylate N-succinyltransferase|uniref:2,3,4,5-tetrahydropyridine-2,6-dicarboxylate N-succinyltransferase n=1 Tax=Phenylobacterium conjunctum TaxID=1298959 RepID=A0ABW3T4R9_9CAUL|nr:2,3,4,5-tetrahydropyridine-2,6-dicarboxylate N-succinyltransferase [Phenylobacterium sp.]HQP19282.1 2,3,4,5-tetrahydropyridine-2,6-dicarboxylate N-succinyltransferase [Phenylobacterium sp.]
MSQDLKSVIEAAWENRDAVNVQTTGEVREAVDETLNQLDSGTLRVASREADGTWVTHQWAKQAILLSFRLNANQLIDADAPHPYWDKIPLKFTGWDAARFEAAGFRAVPGCVVRRGAYIAKGVIMTPSFVNIGAYVDEGTMVDTWATVGSCAQIGKNVHLSGGAGIGGVLEPLQANPTIIEDNCFIGARSEVAEGVIVREGSVLSMGVYLTSTTPIIDRKTGQVTTGEVPPYSVVMSGSRPSPHEGMPSTYCAVIMKTVDARTRSKTSINELLRD